MTPGDPATARTKWNDRTISGYRHESDKRLTVGLEIGGESLTAIVNRLIPAPGRQLGKTRFRGNGGTASISYFVRHRY
jgi:hypothetical protein